MSLNFALIYDNVFFRRCRRHRHRLAVGSFPLLTSSLVGTSFSAASLPVPERASTYLYSVASLADVTAERTLLLPGAG